MKSKKKLTSKNNKKCKEKYKSKKYHLQNPNNKCNK